MTDMQRYEDKTNNYDEPATLRDIDGIEVLRYRPDLSYYPAILSKVEPSQCYETTPVLARVSKVLPSTILGEINDLLDNLDILQKRLESCLSNYSAGGVSFNDYKKELGSDIKDFDKIRAFEKHTRQDINGSMQGEIYPMILDMQQEFSSFRDTINKEFYNNKADYDDLSSSIERDTSKIDDFYDRDINTKLSEIDIRYLTKQSKLCKISIDRVNNAQNHLTNINKVLMANMYSEYGSTIRDIVDTVSKADKDTLVSLLEVNRATYNKTLEESTAVERSAIKANSKETREGITHLTFKAADMQCNKNMDIYDWIGTIDTDFDRDPISLFVADTLSSIENMHEESEAVLMESVKHNELDKMIKEDTITSMLNKKKARQSCNLISSIMKEKDNGTFSLEKFLLDNKLESPGTLCSK